MCDILKSEGNLCQQFLLKGIQDFTSLSREETRMHIHVQAPNGELKIWMEPNIELAKVVNLSNEEANKLLKRAIKRKDEIYDAWNKHFGKE